MTRLTPTSDQSLIASAFTERWYLAYTKPREECVAQVNLQKQNFDVYLPLYKKIKTTGHGLVAAFEPLFPRYIFFRPRHAAQSLSVVRSTKGITTLVRFGFEPAMLHDDVVRRIQQFQQERDQATPLALSKLKAGQSVRLQHNALSGMEGLVQAVSSKRVAVLLEILGRPMVVQLEQHQVEVNT